MKKYFLAATFAASLAIGPALAGSMTIEFTSASGESQVWEFVDDGTANGPNGATASYTWDEATGKMCFEAPAAEAGAEPTQMCLTFADAAGEPSVGDSSQFTTDNGETGTATVTAVTE